MSDLVVSDGRVIHYDVTGPADAECIVLIEGLSAHMLGWRDGFCQFLVDAGYRVVRFDNRDVGLSSHCPNLEYRLSDMAEDVWELIRGLGLDRAHVVGQSMGGMIAQRLAVRHPEALRSLCLLYTAPSADFLTAEGATHAVLEAIPPARNRDEAIEAHIVAERSCASSQYSFDEPWKRHLGGLMYDRCYDPAGVLRQRRAMEVDEFDSTELARVRVPTLIIHGTADRLISDTGSRSLFELIRGSHLFLIDGMGHDLPVELWPVLTSAILQNAARIPQSRHAPADDGAAVDQDRALFE